MSKKRRNLNRRDEVLRDYCTNDILQTRQIEERQKAEAAGLVFSYTKLREIMTDLGFTRVGLGEWGYKGRIVLSTFTHGRLWVAKDRVRVYNNNYKTLLATDLIEVLFNLMQKIT